jgi:hypothetical protein
VHVCIVWSKRHQTAGFDQFPVRIPCGRNRSNIHPIGQYEERAPSRSFILRGLPQSVWTPFTCSACHTVSACPYCASGIGDPPGQLSGREDVDPHWRDVALHTCVPRRSSIVPK